MYSPDKRPFRKEPKRTLKPFIMPEFSNPTNTVHALGTGSVPGTSGCRLECRLPIRSWISTGQIGVTGPFTVNYPFPSDSMGWTTQDALPLGVTENWTSADGNVNSIGCLQIGSDGSGAINTSAYWMLTTTWAALGVPSDKSVTSISFSVYDRIGATGTSSSLTLGPYSLYDSANSTLISTLISGRSVRPGPTSWSQQTSGTVSITSTYQPAATTVVFRAQATINATDSLCNARFDDITIFITYV